MFVSPSRVCSQRAPIVADRVWPRVASLISFATAGVLLFAVHSAQAADASQRPNLVIILADDLGYASVGCYGADPALVRTPRIDALAAQGRAFTDASTTSSVCSPTRYSLLTGRYCWRTPLKFETLNTFAPLHIEPGRLNLASLLKAQGYRTAAIGKWHLGYGSGPARTDYTQPLKPGPLDIGFDYDFAVPQNHGDATGVYVENDRVVGLRSSELRPSGKANPRGTKIIGLDAPQRVDEETMPLLTDKAVNWLERQDASHPFFLYYTPVAVHTPITPSSSTRGTSKAGPFGDWIHELDASVGRILETLDRRGLAENTIVLFTSDNGGVAEPTQKREETVAMELGFQPNKPWRGGKVGCFEGGYRVPYILRWPHKVPAGTRSDQMISVVDTLATVAAIVGQKLPPAEQAAEDSYNVLPAWLGQPHTEPLRPDMITHSCHGDFSIRQGAWKYIEGLPAPGVPERIVKIRKKDFQRQLYNLANDPSEEHNVLAEHPDIAQRLQALLDQQRSAGHTRIDP
jgi:arylsulfatase A-like enzyme